MSDEAELVAVLKQIERLRKALAAERDEWRQVRIATLEAALLEIAVLGTSAIPSLSNAMASIARAVLAPQEGA